MVVEVAGPLAEEEGEGEGEGVVPACLDLKYLQKMSELHLFAERASA